MRSDRELFGRHEETDVYRHTLGDRESGIQVAVIDYGARMQSVLVRGRDGVKRETILGFDNLAGYQNDRDYLGATIGRCANRIAGGRFSLGDRQHQLTVNNGPHHLHGGTEGFDTRLWRVEQREKSPGRDSITFVLVSRDGDQGYPGTVAARVTYALVDDYTLVTEFGARTSAPTLINLTNHAYWNLNDHHADGILDHELTLACPGYLPVDSTLIPTGKVVAVEDSPMDFRTPAVIGTRIERVSGGYDHCYVARERFSGTDEPVPIAILRNPRNGRVVRVSTTKPAIQFYSGNFLNDLPGRSGIVYRQHAGLCLETQYPPDAANRADCPEIILNPGEEYRHVTVYNFSMQ